MIGDRFVSSRAADLIGSGGGDRSQLRFRASSSRISISILAILGSLGVPNFFFSNRTVRSFIARNFGEFRRSTRILICFNGVWGTRFLWNGVFLKGFGSRNLAILLSPRAPSFGSNNSKFYWLKFWGYRRLARVLVGFNDSSCLEHEVVEQRCLEGFWE